MKIESYYINKNGVEGLVKSSGIWGMNGNESFPLVYLRKPKHISEETFQKIIDKIELTIERDFNV